MRAEALKLSDDYADVVRWGRALKPTLPEQLMPPPPAIEDDVVIL